METSTDIPAIVGKGKVAVPSTSDYFLDIQELYSGNTQNSKEFLKNMRQYNSGFAFASMQSNVPIVARQRLNFNLSVNALQFVLSGVYKMQTLQTKTN